MLYAMTETEGYYRGSGISIRRSRRIGLVLWGGPRFTPPALEAG